MFTIDYEIAAKLTAFIVEKTGSCNGYWVGRLTRTEQIEQLGQYFGKGLICVDGEKEEVQHIVKVCFGTDTHINRYATFGGPVIKN